MVTMQKNICDGCAFEGRCAEDVVLGCLEDRIESGADEEYLDQYIEKRRNEYRREWFSYQMQSICDE